MPPSLPRNFDHAKFIERIDQAAELRGMRVILHDGQKLHVLREGPPICAPGIKAIVIKPDLQETTLHSESAAQGRESRLYIEIVSGLAGCSGAVISWIAVLGGAGAAPITGGASTFVVALGWAGAVAGTAQCLNSGVRIYGEVADRELNRELDSQGWYTGTMRALDAVSLLGAGVSTYATIRLTLALRATTGKSMLQVLQGLSRQQRRMLAEELIRRENPAISNTALKGLVRAGQYPKRFTPQSVTQAVRNQLQDAFNAALGFGGSAMSGLIREGGSYAVDQLSDKKEGKAGSVAPATGGALVVGIAEAFDTY